MTSLGDWQVLSQSHHSCVTVVIVNNALFRLFAAPQSESGCTSLSLLSSLGIRGDTAVTRFRVLLQQSLLTASLRFLLDLVALEGRS